MTKKTDATIAEIPTYSVSYVPLHDLRFGHDDECGINVNARRTDRAAGVEELAGMIRAEGLIQSMAGCVGANGKDRPIFIADGNRRLAALHVIYGGKSDTPVPVAIVPRERALEISQSVGVAALPLHPIDQFKTFFDLTQPPHNLTSEQIASRFMIRDAKTVRQRLALGNLSDKIITAWRKEDIGDRAAQAFTMAKDHAEMDRIFDKLKRSHMLHDNAIRMEITGNQKDAAKLLTFVGRKKYEDAGGVIVEDLFNNQHGVSDMTILASMASDRLVGEKKSLAADGWLWVEIEADMGHEYHSWERVNYKAEHKHTKAEKARSGCVVRVASDGTLRIDAGVIRPQDKRKKASADGKATKTADKGVSSALSEKMSTWLNSATARVIETQPKTALVLAIAALSSVMCPIKIGAEGIGSDKMQADGDFGQIIARIAARPDKKRMELLAKHVAASLDLIVQSAGSIMDEEARDIIDLLPALQFEAEMAKEFHANAEDYFNGVNRDQIITAIAEIDPKMKIDDKSAKAVLVKAATEIASKPTCQWLPPELRTKHYRGPKSASKKKK